MKKITVSHAHFESYMSPTVIVGETVDGETVYVRYRWGHLTIRVEGAWAYDEQLDPEKLEGVISYDEIKKITAEQIEWPDEISPPSPQEGDDLRDLTG